MSRTMHHRGFDGSVIYSSENHLLHGRIVGIRDFVLYDGEDVRTLEQNFREAIEEYLRFCEEDGRTPDVPFKGSFNVRVSPDLHQRAFRFAEEHDMKLNNVVQQALSEYLTNAES